MTIRKLGTILAALVALAGCGDRDALPPRPEGAQEAPVPDTAKREVPQSLVGSYRLEGGSVPVVIDETRIRFENCQQVGWTYTYEAGRFRALRARPPVQNGPSEAILPPPCAAPLVPVVAEMARAIDAAVHAETTTAGDLRLSGGGYSITLLAL